MWMTNNYTDCIDRLEIVPALLSWRIHQGNKLKYQICQLDERLDNKLTDCSSKTYTRKWRVIAWELVKLALWGYENGFKIDCEGAGLEYLHSNQLSAVTGIS